MKLHGRVGGRGGGEERVGVVLTYWLLFSGTEEDGDYGGGM